MSLNLGFVNRSVCRHRAIVSMTLLVSACTFGCSASDTSPDASLPDAGSGDAGSGDAGSGDAGSGDAGSGDAGLQGHPMGILGPGLSTLVGYSEPGLVDGPRNFALLANPVNAIVGPAGEIFVADFNNGAIRKVSLVGETTTLVSQPGFSRPFGMVFTPAGDLYVQTDNSSLGTPTGALWKIAPDTGIATIAVDGIGRVRGLASLSDGRLVLSNFENHTLELFDPVAGIRTPLAGEPGVPGFSDGAGLQARFDRPSDVAVASDDTIFVADFTNNRIRQVTLAGVVTTVAGTGVLGVDDGQANVANFSNPIGLALREVGGIRSLYISEFSSGRIRLLRQDLVSTVAGTTPGFVDNTDPLLGQLNVPEGLDIDSAGTYLYIADADGGNDGLFNRVRRLSIAD